MDDQANMQFATLIASLVAKELAEKPPMIRTWFNFREAAEYVRLSPRSLEAAISEGKGPRVRRAGGSKRVLHRDDLDAWILQGGAS